MMTIREIPGLPLLGLVDVLPLENEPQLQALTARTRTAKAVLKISNPFFMIVSFISHDDLMLSIHYNAGCCLWLFS